MIDMKLLNAAMDRMQGLTVADIRVGLGYTAVKNSALGVGLAYTLREQLPQGCTVFTKAGDLVGEELGKIARLFTDEADIIKAAIGLAAINSVAPVENITSTNGDLLPLLNIKRNEWVGMVGRFAPIEKRIREKTNHLFVIEDRIEFRRNGAFKIFCEIMSSCNVMIITATTLINKTLDDILKTTQNARIRVLLGPSTPLFREAFEGEGIDILSGMIVENPAKVIDIVSQGGGTMRFKDYCRKVNLVL